MGPYNSESSNLIYHLLFCDDIDLYKKNTPLPHSYPFDILFSNTSTVADLQKIIDDASAEPRVKVLAYNQQLKLKHTPAKKELLGVIVEVGLEGGLDTLASFADGTARYINQSGKVLVWETTDPASNEITKDLFSSSENIIHKIGPWDQPRRPAPSEGDVRITFLVSDGLYFGEGPMDVLFEDAMASPALNAATELLQYITDKAMN